MITSSVDEGMPQLRGNYALVEVAQITLQTAAYNVNVFHFTLSQQTTSKLPFSHSLANKTVVQLRPKSTTGGSFYWSISGTFVGEYDPTDPSPQKFPFRVSV